MHCQKVEYKYVATQDLEFTLYHFHGNRIYLHPVTKTTGYVYLIKTIWFLLIYGIIIIMQPNWSVPMHAYNLSTCKTQAHTQLQNQECLLKKQK